MLNSRINIIFFFISLILHFNFALNNQITEDFKLGLENISDSLLKNLKSKKKNGQPKAIALVTNQSGIDQQGNRNIDILLSKGLNLKVIFAPEHGIDGKIAAEKIVSDIKDKKTNLPIKSLYMGDSKFKKFEEKDLEDIDVFIFDIQDSGMRHYTYISVLFKIIEICSSFKKVLIVLDRPNPLGYLMEGPLVHSSLISFISIAPIPLRHAMTIGELAKYFNKYLMKMPANLIIVTMKNYQRTMGLNNQLPVALSPNIKNINSCKNYSFLGILGEISPFSILAGTEHAFESLVVENNKNNSKINWNDLKNLLQKCNVDSKLFKYKKFDETKFIGLKIKIKNINNFSGVKTIIAVLKFFKKNGIKIYYSKAFDKAIGTYDFKSFIDGTIRNKNFYANVNEQLKSFYNKAKDLFIYQPLPKIIELK